jgi:3-dehydroquinate synthase
MLTGQFASKTYPIYVGRDLLDCLIPHIQGSQVFIVTQQPLADLYLPPLQKMLAAYQCNSMCLPQGEAYKTLSEWQKIIDQLLQQGHERSTTLIALGGGMVGDMTGFAAACYQRGAHYIQIPTTLIAQVDAAIGAKTAVNHPQAKNMIGAFYPPECVVVDLNMLQTLPERELIAGVAEVIKYGLIADAEFFNWLEQNVAEIRKKSPAALLHAVQTSIAIKTRIVAEDEHDHGVRQTLNFGHTFGHALEVAAAYQDLLHGEAVAMGMRMAAELSHLQGWLSAHDLQRIHRILDAAGLGMKPQYEASSLLTLMKKDKKMAQGKMTFILLKRIGCAERVVGVEDSNVIKSIEQSAGFLHSGI